MKITYLILLTTIFCNQSFAQSIAFMKMDQGNNYLNNAIIENLNKGGLTAKPFYNTQLFKEYDNNDLVRLTNDQIENLKMFSYDFIILHKSEKTGQYYYNISGYNSLFSSKNWQSEFYVFNVNTNQSTVVTLAISTFDCGDMLEACSNIAGFVKQVKDFVQGGSSGVSANETVQKSSTNPNSTSDEQNESPKKKSIFGSSSNTEGKFKVVRVKERNPGNNSPVAIDVYDKSLSLKVGDNIIITRTDEVKIPGEKKTRISKTTIGKAKITEDYNKPLYTAKLISNDGFKMKDYKDGDENYIAVMGEDDKVIVSKPSIMVIPKKIDPAKLINGEYQLRKEEKMLIAAFKNKFEDNKFTTLGFESSLKSVLEKRQLNDSIQEDIKSRTLEASGIDFFVEYEDIDYDYSKENLPTVDNPYANYQNCERNFVFKIRNYSTGEDIASDVKTLDVCGTPDHYKSFASAILNSGAISKINTQFSTLLSNGRKISIVFSISKSSQAKFSKEYNGTKLGVHINNCLQSLAFQGNLELESESDLRKDATVYIPILDESNGQKYQSTTFAEEILVYLKTYAGIECERVVSRQVITIKIK